MRLRHPVLFVRVHLFERKKNVGSRSTVVLEASTWGGGGGSGIILHTQTKHTHTHTRKQTHTHIHTHTHTQPQIRAHTRTHTHTHIIQTVQRVAKKNELRQRLVRLHSYGMATISRLLKMIGLFCRTSSLLLVSFAKETYNFQEPTSHSHPIVTLLRSSRTH